MDKLNHLIENQIKIIEQTTGAQIAIHDNYGILSKTELKNLPQINRWHLNKYCLFVKDNPQIFHKCVGLKHKFYEKVKSANCAIKTTCFCGVAEISAPIFIDEVYVGIVSLMNFIGDYSSRQYRNLAKRLNISLDELLQLKDTYLQPIKNQDDIKTQLEILVYLIKNYLKNESSVPKFINQKSKITNSYVIKALEYIDRDFTKNITVDDVAKTCFISVPYLQNLFSEFLGHGIAEEIRNKRIIYAKELLCTTEYSVKRIAFECGFESADYFSVVFKKLCGITPLKFRKSHNRF